MGDLKLIRHDVTGHVCVKENSQYNNIKAEKVVVAENVTVRLYGSVSDVVIKKGAIVYIHGEISGNVENEGGEIHIYR